MAAQLVANQLAKPLNINASNIASPAPQAVPDTMHNPPLQQPFPQYHPGYTNPNLQSVRAPIPPRPTHGQTSTHPYDMASNANLHPVLFQMDPPPNPYCTWRVPALLKPNGQLELGNSGKGLRFFNHLPRWIPVGVDGLLIETWLRLDFRMEMRDILDRLDLRPGDDASTTFSTTLSMRRQRARDSINVVAACTGRKAPLKYEVDVIANLTREQILLNTCMGVDLADNRLLKPILDDGGYLLGYVNSGLPLNYFLQGFPAPIKIPSDRQIVALELRKRLQTLARHLGKGSGHDNYNQLTRAEEPLWWHRKTGAPPGRRIVEIDNLTHAQWLERICGQYPGIGKDGNQRAPTALAATSAPPTIPQPPPPQLAPPPPQTPPRHAPQPQTPQRPPPAMPRSPVYVPPIDPRLLNGTWASAPTIAPSSYPNAYGGQSHYVPPSHQQAMSDAHRAAQEQNEIDRRRRNN